METIRLSNPCVKGSFLNLLYHRRLPKLGYKHSVALADCNDVQPVTWLTGRLPIHPTLGESYIAIWLNYLKMVMFPVGISL